MASEQVVSYVLRYGGRCRDCADEDGICPTNGMPCEPEVKRAVINHTLKALGYGISHGFIADPFTRPAPAATDTGLVTVAKQWKVTAKNWSGLKPEISEPFDERELVTRSQAEELLAAERAEKEKIAAAVKKLEAAWRDHSQKVATLETQLAAAKKALETKSAANEALSKSVVESIDTEKRLREALEPFSKFAGAVFERNFNNTDVIFEISASDGGVLELTGKDFFEARAVLGGKSS